MTTRQKEVLQIQKDLEKLELKLDHTVTQLRAEMKNGLEIIGSDVKKMFEQVMLKLSSPSRVMEMKDYGSNAMTETKLKEVSREEEKELPKARDDGIEEVTGSRLTTKYTKLECPRFDGSNFRGWYLKIE